VEECGVDGDGEQGDEGASDGWGACVAGGVEGTCVDTLHCPYGECYGEDSEEVCGCRGIGVVELAAAEEVHQPGREGDHPCGDDHADGEEAGDGAGDGVREVSEALLLEERGEEWERGGSGGGADDVEGGVEEVFGIADEGDATVAE